MHTFLVLGAGGIGRSTAAELVALGHNVTVMTRRGTDVGIPGVASVAGDASDADAIARHASGARAIVNAINPRYTQWQRDWPPVAAAILTAAERTGAGLVTVSNLYGYGPVDAPMTEQTPLATTGTKGRVRADMWRQALAAHAAGRVRVTEVRASDYFGGGIDNNVSLLNAQVLTRAVAGKTVWLITGDPDMPHSYTYLPDIGRLMATVATDDRSWGSAWHVPSPPAKTVREVVADVGEVLGQPPVAVKRVPTPVRVALRVVPLIREFQETDHQRERPFVLDSSLAERTFGLAATPWRDALASTLGSLQTSSR